MCFPPPLCLPSQTSPSTLRRPSPPIMDSTPPAVDRLKQLKNKRIAECDENIQRFTKVVKQLESLREKLSTLPDKTRYTIHVPVGVTSNPNSPPPLLMRGTLKHTNEILVLLGDNWFVERSAKEAVDIINRRIEKTQNLIKSFEEDKKQQANWSSLVETLQQESQEFVDIREEYDEEKEKAWKEKRRQRVREHNQQQRLEREMAKVNITEEEDEDEKPVEETVKEKNVAATANKSQSPPAMDKPTSVSRFKASRQKK